MMADRIGQKLGNYRITQSLGRGGFAEVYLGEHIYLKTFAAVKVLYTRLSISDDMESFIKEAQTVAQLSHPNIVRVLDFGVDNETPFLVMDYAPKGTLRQRHARNTQLAPSMVLPYVKQIADALQYAHDERFIHRDVKPENMLVGKRNEILLSDFGIALVAQSSRNQSTQDVTGTVTYMAPEQIQGKSRPASDQYSLGVTVYEWLAGSPPFRGSFTELCVQHMYAEVPPLREQIPTLSREVEQVVMTALAKDPKQRFGSITAFANALEQAAGQRPVATPRIPSGPLPNATPPAKAPINAAPPPVQIVQTPPTPARLANQAPVAETKVDTTGGARATTGAPQFRAPSYEPIRNTGGVGRRLFLPMIIGTVIYTASTFVVDKIVSSANSNVIYTPIANVSFLPNIASLLIGIILTAPFFFSSKFGPWVGLVVAVAGALLGDLLSGTIGGVSWYWYLASACLGFLSGLSFYRTRGHYYIGSAIRALFYAVIGLLVLNIITAIGDSIVHHINFFSDFIFLTLSYLVSLILLPVFLRIFRRVTY